MAVGLVGTIGTVAVSASAGAACSPGWGTSENRVAGNLLVCWVAGSRAATLPTTPAGWSIARQRAGTSASMTIYVKRADGADAAPSFTTASVIFSAQLAEFSGVGASIPNQSSDNVATTTSPVVATDGAVDLLSGALVLVGASDLYSAAATKTLTHTVTGGATVITATSNAGTSTRDHYSFGYGPSTTKLAATSDSYAFTTTSGTGQVVVLATFPPGSRPTSSLTLNAVIRVTDLNSFLLNAVIKVIDLNSLTLNAVIQKTPTGSFGASAIAKAVQSSSFTVGASIKGTPTSSLTVAAVVKGSKSGTMTADAIRRATGTGTFTANSVVKSVPSASFPLDAVSKGPRSGTFPVNAAALKSASGSFSINATILKAASGSFAANAAVLKTPTGSFGSNAALLAATASATHADAAIKAGLTGTPWAADAVVIGHSSASFRLEAVLNRKAASSWLIDGVKLASGSGSFPVAATILRKASSTSTIDASVLSRPNGSFSLSGAILRLVSSTSVVDAVVGKAGAGAFSLGAIMRLGRTASLTADAILLVNQKPGFTLAAYLTGAMGAPPAFDGSVFDPAFEGGVPEGTPFPIDAVVLGPRGSSFSIRAVIQSTRAHSFDASAWVSPRHFTLDASIGALARVTQAVLEVLSRPSDASARVTQAPVEVLTHPWDASARVTQMVIEVLVLRSNGFIALDAVIKANPSTDFTIRAAIGTGAGFTLDAVASPRRFNLDAIRFRSGAGSFPVAAGLLRPTSKAYTANAIRLARQSGSFSLSAAITFIVVHPISVGAFIQPYFRVDARLDLGFHLDATVLSHRPGTFTSSSVVFGPRSGLFTVKAVIRSTFASAFTLDAETVPAHFRVDAIKGQTIGSGFVVEARVGGGGSTFSISAVLLATVGPGLRPLTFPGTSRTRGGLTTNVLSPAFPISTGEQAVVVVDSPPSDGGDLSIAGSLTGYSIPTDTGEHDVVAIPGVYYVVSFKGNTYRPTLSGAGSYKDWGTGLQFAVGAFIQPRFAIDARFCWTFGSTFTLSAAIKARIPGSFTVAAFIRPTFRIDARIASRHFSVDAWIKCEFTLDAWLSRRITGSFPVSAFVRGYFRASAVVTGSRYGSFDIAAWFTNPVFGLFRVSAWVQPFYRVDASKVITYYRHDDRGLKVDAWKISGIASSFTLDARIRPNLRVDAVIFGTRTWTLGVDAYVSNTKYGSFSVGAFIEGAFRLDATLLKIVPSSMALNSAIVRRPQGSFTISAGITGFLVDAVLFKPNQQAFFSLFAIKGRRLGSGTFTVNAEKYDASAYWDQYWEMWLHPHFYVDAFKLVHRGGSFHVGAAIILPGQPITTTFLDAAIVKTGAGQFLIEAFIWSQHTVVHEGAGEVVSVLENRAQRVVFPGLPGDPGPNQLYGPLWFPPYQPVVLTVWVPPSMGTSVGIASLNENLWVRVVDQVQGPGRINVAYGNPTTITFWPSYFFEPYYLYAWTPSGVYEPSMTGDALLTYSQRVDRILSYPAPPIDAWIVGTIGEPFTLDAEIVSREKTGVFTLAADLSAQGEQRGSWVLDASILGAGGAFFYTFAQVAARGFTLDACFYMIHFTADAFVQPYLYLDAAITRGGSGSFVIDAWSYLPTKVTRFVVEAETAAVGDRRGSFPLDAVVLGGKQGQRIYLAANIVMAPAAFALDAMVAPWFGVDAWVSPVGGGLGGFSIGAYIRGSSFIIFPEDGGAPTDPLGDPPALTHEFSILIEAGIPRPIPIGNDAEIERLITLILEAEAELDALYCAVESFSSQGYTSVRGPSPNPSGGGYNRSSSLPGAISQIGYPNAGDLDDCWLVATVWAAVASGQTYQPDATTYRRAALNPDRPGPTGGTPDQTYRGARGCWPGANLRRYASTDWNGFTSLLRAGWVASLAVSSAALPGYLQYGFRGLHQIGVAYQNGAYYVDNPLMSNGTRPASIDETILRTAARSFSGGVICATMFG